MSYPHDMEEKDILAGRDVGKGGGPFSVCFGSFMYHHFNGLSPCYPGFVCDPIQCSSQLQYRGKIFSILGSIFNINRLERPSTIPQYNFIIQWQSFPSVF